MPIGQISEAVGVSKAALYYYFKDKEELFLAILEIIPHEMETSIDTIRAGTKSNTEQICRFVEAVLSLTVQSNAPSP